MRRTLIVVLSIAILGAAVTLGGCVSTKEYGRSQSANRQASRHIQELLEKAREADSQIAQLLASLQSQREAMESGASETRLARGAYGDLKTQFDDLQKLYDTEISRDPAPMMGALPAKVHVALRSLAAANSELMEYLPKHGMVKMKSDLSFGLGSAEVKAGASAALGKLSSILQAPAAAKLNVYIAGHTDDVPIRASRGKHATNWHLSAHRAIGVQKVLTRAGMAPARIGVMGFGEHHPVEPNKPNKKGNPANRRVEIWIIPQSRLLTLPASVAPAG